MKLNNFNDLLVMLLLNIKAIQTQIQSQYPQIIKKVRAQDLKDVLENHVIEIGNELPRVNSLLNQLNVNKIQIPEENPIKNVCNNIQALLKDNTPTPLLDAAIISFILQIEYLEAASYSSLEAYAEMLNLNDIQDFLEESLREVHKVDEALEKLAKLKFFSPMAVPGE